MDIRERERISRDRLSIGDKIEFEVLSESPSRISKEKKEGEIETSILFYRLGSESILFCFSVVCYPLSTLTTV